MSIPDIDRFEERAAIAEHDGGCSRRAAEDLAAQAQGFKNAEAYWQWLADYVVNRTVSRPLPSAGFVLAGGVELCFFLMVWMTALRDISDIRCGCTSTSENAPPKTKLARIG